ncbi:hypothetical protein N7495_003802, partial [Penicillium taxi]|uniref:uncharacterized protein n=1 Tax=Penicillium taxi TaxID=168475 RepID=UPI002545978D
GSQPDMAEPTDPMPGESANTPVELNTPAPQPPSHPALPLEDIKQSLTESLPESLPEPNEGPASTSEPHPQLAPPTVDPNQQSSISTINEQANPPAVTPNTTTSAVDHSLPTIDTSLPPMGPSQPILETALNDFDSSLQSVGSSAAPDLSLPAIDTSMPSFDSALPAIGTDIPTMDDDHSFGDHSFGDHDQDVNSGAADPGNNGMQQHGSMNGATHYQTSNGNYQYSQSPAPSQQQEAHQPPGPSQHQFQAQPQPSYQPNLDIYHNQGGFAAVNTTPGSGQGQPGQIPQAPIGSPMPPSTPIGQYMTGYSSNGSQQSMNSNAQMRYPHPGDPNKMLSGGRHKKEVKRRTKTGCLTCRKRRIKCDEGHPVCRNCVKSKRDCMGYDPVFRPQASTPSVIQPAAPNPPPSLVVNPQGPPISSTPSYPSAPPGYMPASSQPFTPTFHSESPSTSIDQPDHGASLENSLGPINPQSSNGMQSSIENAETSYKVKNLHAEDLLSVRGIAPPPPHPISTLPQVRIGEIQAVFLATYAPAIDKLLEVRWYMDKALPVLMADAQLMADYAALIVAFNEWDLDDQNSLARLESFEASIIWRSMCLCRQVPNAKDGQHGSDWNLLLAYARLDAIEALVTWKHLEENALSRQGRIDATVPPDQLPRDQSDQFLLRQLDFWEALGTFLTLHDNEASSAKQIDDTLGRVRQLLDTYENRDIIYSIAITRHFGQRWPGFPNNLPHSGTTSEKELGTKLFVAQKFIEDEAGGKGTSQVYKRLCGMAVRSWWIA